MQHTTWWAKNKYPTHYVVGDASFIVDLSLSERGSLRELRAPMLRHRARVGSVECGDAAMSKDASAGEKPPAPTRDAPSTNQTQNADAVIVEQTHRVTRDGITTTTTVTTPTQSQRISEAVADQLHHAFDIHPEAHDLTTTAAWTYADHALTRLTGGDRR